MPICWDITWYSAHRCNRKEILERNMGTEFAIIYDLAVAAILIGMLFAGLKKGFASSVIGLAAVFVAFACAMLFSEPITDAVYVNFVEKPVEEAVNATLDDAAEAITLGDLSKLDYSRVKVSGVPVEDIEPNYTGTNKAMFDLSDVDLSETGIAQADLTAVGITADTDFTSVNAKTAEFTMTDIDRYGLGEMIVAQYISVSMQSTNAYRMFARFAQSVGQAVPLFFGDFSEEIVKGSVPAVRSVVLIMQTTAASAKEAMINGIVEPCCRIAVQTLAFGVIFIVVTIVLNLLARMLEFVNKIPLVGGLNAFCGGIVGAAQGLVAICVVCLAVRLITVLTGGNVMFFNNAAIEATFVFKYFYGFEFLNFIG